MEEIPWPFSFLWRVVFRSDGGKGWACRLARYDLVPETWIFYLGFLPRASHYMCITLLSCICMICVEALGNVLDIPSPSFHWSTRHPALHPRKQEYYVFRYNYCPLTYCNSGGFPSLSMFRKSSIRDTQKSKK